jgi:hypothetical protein
VNFLPNVNLASSPLQMRCVSSPLRTSVLDSRFPGVIDRGIRGNGGTPVGNSICLDIVSISYACSLLLAASLHCDTIWVEKIKIY